MANKLYEESNIKDIADAIREKNGSTDTYTVAQMGSAIRNIPSGGESADVPYRRFTGQVTGTVVGSGAYVTLATDPVLAEHRNDNTLMAIVSFDVGTIAYTIVSSVGVNSPALWPLDGGTGIYQRSLRWDGSTGRSVQTGTVPIKTDSPAGVGCIQITADGELRIYSNSSSNYAIRPSNFTAEVRW